MRVRGLFTGPTNARRRGLLVAGDVMAVLLAVVLAVSFRAEAPDASPAVRASPAPVLGDVSQQRYSALGPVAFGEQEDRTVAVRADGAQVRDGLTPLMAGTRPGVVAVAAAVIALSLVFFFLISATRVIVRTVRRPADGDAGDYDSMVASLAASQDRLRQVADMQGALRRVATLVARGVSASEVFAAVAAEVGHVVEADHTVIVRFEAGETARVVAHWNDPRMPQVMPPLDGHWPIENGTVTATVRSTERPFRMNDYTRNTTAIGWWAHKTGIRCLVGCPVKVEGRVWGAMIIHSLDAEPMRGITEDRMQEFVELVGTAIANAQSRSDLLASRARVVAAADESRRRIERDLHDGAQQRLVTLALKLRAIQMATDGRPGPVRLADQLGGLVHDLSDILDDLQKVSRGIIPPILTRSGLPPALRSLARHSTVPVRLNTEGVVGRLPERVEVAVYYTVSEALTNVVKHSRASEVCVDLTLLHQTARLSVRDDGCGGADLSDGTGLVGLKDRVEALGGHIDVRSPPGDGTTLLVEIPIVPAKDPACPRDGAQERRSGG